MEERKVPNIPQLRMSSWRNCKRTPVATCEALVNSMSKRVKAVLENNGGHTKYWHLINPIWTFSLRGVLTFVASSLDINGCVLSYFEGLQIYTVLQAVLHSLLYIVAKCNFKCCHMKIYNKIFTKMWGVYSLLWGNVYSFHDGIIMVFYVYV